MFPAPTLQTQQGKVASDTYGGMLTSVAETMWKMNLEMLNLIQFLHQQVVLFLLILLLCFLRIYQLIMSEKMNKI